MSVDPKERLPAARGALAALCLLVAACAESRELADPTFEPTRPGTLTVATSLPAPGFWDGDGVDRLTGGYEYGIAEALAERFDLDLEVVDVSFDRLVTGELDGADLALAQITITDERRGDLAFSVPYYDDDVGAVVPGGDELTDLKTAKEQRWAVQPGTIEATILDDDVRPDDEPMPCADAPGCVNAVADGRADAALVDLSTALILTNGRDDVTVGGQIIIDGEIAAALPPDSGNLEVVDAELRLLRSDGTLDDLADEFLAPVFEREPASIPAIRMPS